MSEISKRELVLIDAKLEMMRSQQKSAVASIFIETMLDQGFGSVRAGEIVDALSLRPQILFEHDSSKSATFHGWHVEYVMQGFMHRDRLFFLMLEEERPVEWSEGRSSASKKELTVYEEAAKYGFQDGFSVPAVNFGGFPGVVSVAGGKDCFEGVSPREKGLFYELSRYAFWAESRHTSYDVPPLPELSEREEFLAGCVLGNIPDKEIAKREGKNRKAINREVNRMIASRFRVQGRDAFTRLVAQYKWVIDRQD